MADVNELGATIVRTVRSLIQRVEGHFNERLAKLEEQLATLTPREQLVKVEMDAAVLRGVADETATALTQIRELVEQRPERGEKGEQGERGEPGEPGAHGVDGRDADPVEVARV